jgi:hypothetical protein
MSLTGKEEEARREEIVKTLKSKPILPQIKTREPGEAIALRARSTPEARIDIVTAIIKERRSLKQELQLKPITTKIAKLTPREPRKGVDIEPVRPNIVLRRVEKVKIELKPQVLRSEVEEPKVLKLRKIDVSIKQVPGRKLEIPLRPPEDRAFERVKMARPPKIIIKPALPTALVPRGMRAVIEGEGSRPPETERPYESLEEEVFIPPILKKLSLVTKSVVDRPICIIVPKREGESFVGSIATICREIYRIVKGDKPSPRWISEGLKDEIESYLRAGNMIFVVDDSKCKLLSDILSKVHNVEDLLEKVDVNLMLDRLREFFSQDFGFVIFHVNERWANAFSRLLREKAGIYVKERNIIEIPPLDWPIEVKETLAKVLWDFVERGGGAFEFDRIFSSYEEEFLRVLDDMKRDVELRHWINRDENAGEEHEVMKAIVVECVAKELGATRKDEVIQMLKRKDIETECEVSGGRRADICVRRAQRFIEVETFYGTGDPISRKLDTETLAKYREMKGAKVDIVLFTGIQALLYAEELNKLAEIYRKEYSLEVKFYIPNIVEKKLVPLKQVIGELRKVFSSLKPVGALTEKDVERLWNEFSRMLQEHGIDPEEERYKRLFKCALNYSKSYEENLNYIKEEIKNIIEQQKKEVEGKN